MKKRIITVVGKDSVGITAKVCVYLANNQINILDISQTIVAGYFNMMMIADTAKCEKDGGTLQINRAHRIRARTDRRRDWSTDKGTAREDL